MLRVGSIVKRFGAKTAVDAVSLSVGEGELVGLVGPNGAGKSTTMRIISGLLKPDSGIVAIDEVTFSDNAQLYLSKLGALIESPAFYPSLNGLNHLTYLARMRGLFNKTFVGDALARVGLSSESRKPVREYSTGMKQRLGIAMATLHKPRLLILDEPTNGLDPAAIVAMRDLLKDLANDGTAILVSSHFLYEIERVCNRVVFIKAGRVVRDEKIQCDVPSIVRMLVRSSNLDAAQEILCQQDFVLETQPTEKGLFCTVSSQSLGKLAAVVVNAGLDLLELSPANEGLEDTYISEYGSGMSEGLG